MLFLIALFLKLLGAENATPLEEMLAINDMAATKDRWQQADCCHIAVESLGYSAKVFYITQVQSSTLKTRHGRSSRPRARKI